MSLAGCSVNNLSYPQVLQDIDCALEVDGQGEDQRLVYRTEVEATWGIARWSLMVPFRWFLFPLFGERVERKLDNPSAYVRELVEVMAPKAGADPLRCSAATQRLVRIAELDPAPINRITALNGLAQIARARGRTLTDGVAQLGARPPILEQATQWQVDFARLRPAARASVGGPLGPVEEAAYRDALMGLSSRPLPSWRQRLGWLADLENALFEERQEGLREQTRSAWNAALDHAAQRTVVEASMGRNRELSEVRICSMELLHRSGGADCVPLLLALVAASPEQIQSGEPQFEDSDALRLRLVHMCGQLDQARAMQSIRIHGRENWQEVTPAEYLGRLSLEGDPFLSATALPAREALAFCLGRRDASPDPGSAAAEDWVAAWWSSYRKDR